jgi:hypothetical protein
MNDWHCPLRLGFIRTVCWLGGAERVVLTNYGTRLVSTLVLQQHNLLVVPRTCTAGT